MTKEEALTKALNQLKRADQIIQSLCPQGYIHPALGSIHGAIVNVQEALAQPEQEPVACKHEWFRTGAMEPGQCRCIKCGAWNTAPPQRTWVGLTDEEIDYFIVHRLTIATKNNLAALIRICEAKLKEKNQ